MDYKLSWQDRRDLTDSLREMKGLIDSADGDIERFGKLIDQSVEAISNLANRVDSQELLLNSYKSVLRDVLGR